MIDFFIESLVNNESAGRFVPTTESGYTARRSRLNDDNRIVTNDISVGGGAGPKTKHYGNEKTAWSQQHTYPLSMSPSDGNSHHRIHNNNARPLRVDESGIAFDEPLGGGMTNNNSTTTINAKATAVTYTGDANIDKNVNKRRKRVETRKSRETNNCADERVWSETMADSDYVEHNVRRWIYNATSYANKTVSFR